MANTKKELKIGVWAAPRKEMTETQEDADRRYAEVAEFGANTICAEFEWYCMANLLRLIKACEKNNLKVIVGLPLDNYNEAHRIMEETKNSPAVISFNLIDEPNDDQLFEIGRMSDLLRPDILPGQTLTCNLLTNGAFGWDGVDYGAYHRHVVSCGENSHVDTLSFDNYPYGTDSKGDPDAIKRLMQNLLEINMGGKRFNVPTADFIQCSSWSGTREPSENEIRFICHLSLAFGIAELKYFLYQTPYNVDLKEGIFSGALDFDGNRTPVFDRCKTVNKELSAFDSIFLQYNQQNIMLHNPLTEYVDFDTPVNFNGFILSLVTPLKEVVSDGQLLISNFESDGKKALYIVNFDTTENGETSVTLNFTEKYSISIWSKTGCENLSGTTDTLSRTLIPGEGIFVELK